MYGKETCAGNIMEIQTFCCAVGTFNCPNNLQKKKPEYIP